MIKSRLAALFCAFALGACPALGDTLVFDTFEDGNPLRTGASDANWYRVNNTPSTDPFLSVQSDSVLGSRALKMDRGGQFTPVVGTFYHSPAVLGPGSQIDVGFTFRILAAPNPTTSAFRVGLYDSGGAQVAGDLSSVFNDDPGYFAFYGVGAADAGVVREPSSSNAAIAGGTNVPLENPFVAPGAIAASDTSRHTGRFSIAQDTSGTFVTVSLFIDGNLVARGTDSVGPFSRFDEIAFGNGISNQLDVSLDDITVTTLPNSVPLPIPLLGGVVLLMARCGFSRFRRRTT